MPRHRTRSGLTRVDLLVIIAMLTSVQSDKGLGACRRRRYDTDDDRCGYGIHDDVSSPEHGKSGELRDREGVESPARADGSQGGNFIKLGHRSVPWGDYWKK